jgi:hypothetical protein
VEPGDDLAERLERVVDGAAEIAGVEVMPLAPHFQLDAEGTAQGFGHCRAAGPQHRHIGHDGGIGPPGVLVVGDEIAQVGAADLLFAFEDALHIDGKRAGAAQPAFERLDVGEHLSLVVGGATAVEAVAAQGRRKGRRDPVCERLRWLNVVVPVDQDGRSTRDVQPVRRDDRMVPRGNHPHVLQTDRPQVNGEPVRAAPYVCRVNRLRADAGETDERSEFGHKARPRGTCMSDRPCAAASVRHLARGSL